MGKEIDYKTIYKLQDEIMSIVSSLDNGFYITGGTALHRFYYNLRYSDDLDFFVTNSYNFHEDVAEVLEALNQKFNVKKTVVIRDFYRIWINDLLQLDFVNDKVYRYGKSNVIKGIRVDNKINIFTNKLGAIISRDEEKDIFDLFCFVFNESFNWKNIFEIANKKTIIQKDIFIYRLKSFPLTWLKRIKVVKKNIEITKKHVEILCDDILKDRNNSLCPRTHSTN